MAISDRIAVMDRAASPNATPQRNFIDGRRSGLVAGFLGRTNLLDASCVGQDGDRIVVDIAGQRLAVRTAGAFKPGDTVRAMIRPEAIGIGPAGEGLRARVVTRTYLGDKVEYVASFASQDLHIVRFNPAENEHFAPGSEVMISLPSDGVQLLPRD